MAHLLRGFTPLKMVDLSIVMLVYQRVLGRAAGFHVLPPVEANENNQIVPKHPGTLIN
jgi:hypothetical protein